MTETTLSDISSLLARLGTGDASAREDLLLRTQERLRQLASRMLRGSFNRVAGFEETDDVLQTMMFRLFKSWDKVVTGDEGRPLSDAGEYLSRASRLLREVLLDMARHHYGRGSGRPRVQSLNADDSSTSGRPGIDPGSDTHDPDRLYQFTEFHQAVDRLPEHFRRVVDLHWYQGLPHIDVAQLMGIGESTVRKYWVGARLQLKDSLHGNPIDWFGA
jgi:RNA polymerase sigma factor (sigma-70 family)